MITGACCSTLISSSWGALLWAFKCAAHQRSASTNSSGVSSIDKATQATSNDDTSGLMTSAPSAAWNTTNPNSPPCASKMMNTGRSLNGMGSARAIAHSTKAFTTRKPHTTATTNLGCAITTAKSMLMPTAMKKRPSSKPLKGSMSVSNSRRYSLSAKSTPAKKAPRAIDKPTLCIKAAVATTKSSAAAVKISGVSLRAIQRRAGRKSKRPPSTMAAMTPSALPASTQPLPCACAALLATKSGTSAKMGMAAMSCNSATLKMFCPAVVAIRLRSRSTPRPMAVDDMAKPKAATQPSRQGTSKASAMPNIKAAEPNNCALPQPKIGRRKAHRRRGSNSRPTRKSIKTTPNSANWNIAAGSVTKAKPQGPMAMPAPR